MTTTTESNMLNMHQSPMVLGWGQNNINSSFPINAKKLQIVFPSSGRAEGWQPNQNLEYRQLLDKNSAMSLHGSYFQVQFNVGRSKNWTNTLDATAAPWNVAGRATTGGIVSSLADIQPLDSIDRVIMYSHWNPARLIQNCTLWLGSTNVETVNNVPFITDAKYAFYSPDAVKTTMSDCMVLPPDGNAINGTPMIHQFTSLTPLNIVDNWIDTTICTYNLYSVQGRNDGNPGPLLLNRGPNYAQGQICVQPMEYFIRNGQYVCSAQDRHSVTSRAAGILSFSGIVNAEVDSPAGSVNWFLYGTAGTSAAVPVPGGVVAAPYQAASNPTGANQYGFSTVTKRIPLSSLFGFCEQNVLVPSTLVQINLVRARDDQFLQSLWTPQFPAGAGAPFTFLPARQYGIFIKNISLVLKYFDLNQTAADILSQDQLLTVNHYSLYSNVLTASNSTNGSVALQAYAGLKSLLVRITPAYGVPGQSVPVGKTGTISVIYRGKQTPLQLEQYSIDMVTPIGGDGGTYGGEPPCAAFPSTYFEEYSSWNGNCWNGVSASLAPSAGFNCLTWFKSQFTIAFNFVEDQSQNSDTVAAPVQLNYNFGERLYDMEVATTTPPTQAGPKTVPVGVSPNTYTIQVVFLRTNIIKYLGASRQFVFVTNGSS